MNVNVNPLTKDNYVRVINCLKAWRVQTKKFRFQREHLAFNVAPAVCPPEAMLESMCIPMSDKPSEKVETDVSLDNPNQPLRSLPSSSAKAKLELELEWGSASALTPW